MSNTLNTIEKDQNDKQETNKIKVDSTYNNVNSSNNKDLKVNNNNVNLNLNVSITIQGDHKLKSNRSDCSNKKTKGNYK